MPLSKPNQTIQSPPQEEVYGYYGRVASPPPPPTSTTRGSYSAIRHLDNHQEVLPSEEMPASASELADVAEGGGGGGAEAAGDDETFVPSFEVPEGVAVPSSPRQHIMIVGTARTTVRSPQVSGFDLEIILVYVNFQLMTCFLHGPTCSCFFALLYHKQMLKSFRDGTNALFFPVFFSSRLSSRS